MKQIIKISPLALLVLVCVFFLLFIIFEKDPNNPPSALLNKEMPNFATTSLFNKNVKLSSDNIKRNVNLSADSNVNFAQDTSEKYTLVNFFASWCTPCRAEHHLFFKLKRIIQMFFFLEFPIKTIQQNQKNI